MKINNKPITVIISALLITMLFHRHAIGLNLIIYEAIFVLWLFISKQFSAKGFNNIFTLLCLVITSAFTVINYSTYTYIIHFLTLLIFIGTLIYSNYQSTLTSLKLSLASIFKSQAQFFRSIGKASLKGRNLASFIRKISIFIIPLAIVVVFVFIYRKSNPVFDEINTKIGGLIGKIWSGIFENFDSLIILTFLLAFAISNILLLRVRKNRIIEKDQSLSDNLTRIRNRTSRNFKPTALKNEFKAGVFLLGVLNLILLLVNIIDINWVWFNFEWEGQFLKQFVHEGTYLLILSILISIVLVLYFFKRNLNFYRNNKTLRILSYIWLAQNAILTISVGIRNTYYISKFSLAYKRIGVIFFLILTLYGLFTVYKKVKNKKTTSYLVRANFKALFVLLVVSSCINWDIVIARYNFKHYQSSFVHLDYLVGFSDKTLHILDKPIDKLSEIAAIQDNKFDFVQNYMSPDTYFAQIQYRKDVFTEKWESKGFLSWNLAEHRAYKSITGDRRQ